MNKSLSFILVFLLLLIGVGCSGQPGTAVDTPPGFPEQSTHLSQAAAWLVANHQNEDGGYSAFSGGANLADSDPIGAVDALLALSAANADTTAPLGYLGDNANDLVAFTAISGGSAGKIIVALVAAGENPRDFNGHDFLGLLSEQLSTDGAYNAETAFEQAFALLGLAAAGETVPDMAVQWLKDQQTESGAWGDGYGTDENSDATGMAVMALVASGEAANSEPLSRAANWLAANQLADGSWEYGPGYGGNASSTALVVQALSALGEDFYSSNSPWAKEGQTPLQALLSFRSDSGAFQADFGSGPFDDFFTTVQVMPALTGRPYPIQ